MPRNNRQEVILKCEQSLLAIDKVINYNSDMQHIFKEGEKQFNQRYPDKVKDLEALAEIAVIHQEAIKRFMKGM